MENITEKHIKSESHADSNKPKIDTGLNCLVMIAKFHNVAADPEQIKHAFAVGNDGMSATDILRAAKELGFKAKEASVEYERLQKLPLPGIAIIQAIGNRQETIDKKDEAKGDDISFIAHSLSPMYVYSQRQSLNR